MRKFLKIEIYKNSMTDSSNQGVSTRSHVFVSHPEGTWTKESIECNHFCSYAFLEVVSSPLGDDYPKQLKEIGEDRWTMFGGNFGWSSDSRVSRWFNGSPLKIMDRIES